MKRSLQVFGCALVAMLCANARATVYQFTGTYTANYGGGPVANMSANFQFDFDDSIVNPVGNQLYNNLPLNSLTYLPAPLGATTFTSANTGGGLFYTNGVLKEVIVGGLLDGANTISGVSLQSDFYFDHNLSKNVVNGVYHLPPNGALGSGGNGTANLTITVIPEPASASLLAVGILARRRRS